MLICLGAANALANPRRLLRSMPPAMHEVSTAVVVALSVFPQLAESVMRVRRARTLRPDAETSRIKAMRMIVIPVLEDALDRSMLLAASMDSRGYGRTAARSRGQMWLTGTLMVSGLVGLCISAYALLDSTAPRVLASPLLVCSAVVGVAGIVASGQGRRRTSYRPDRWRGAELLVVASGFASGCLLLVSARTDPANLYPSLSPLGWPQLPIVPLLGIVLGLLPALAAPLPEPVDASARPVAERAEPAEVGR
jgi:energy-coupling factor transport system permease protein